MTLNLFNFNNYYNRIIKKFNSINEYFYDENSTYLGSVNNVTNWNPNDGISTKQIINYPIQGFEKAESASPDYVVITDSNFQIDSRWFVIESKRTRAMQFELTLYRDVIADWYDEIVEAPMFIEKAITSINDTAIFNNENMTYNKIKANEWLLMDKSRCPWIIGYVTKEFEGGKFSYSETIAEATEYNSLTDYPYYKYNSGNPIYPTSNIEKEIISINFSHTSLAYPNNTFVFSFNPENREVELPTGKNFINSSDLFSELSSDGRGFKLKFTNNQTPYFAMRENAKMLKDSIGGVMWDNFSASQANWGIDVKYVDLEKENGRILKVGDKYYNVEAIPQNERTVSAIITKDSALGNTLYNLVKECPNVLLTNQKSPLFEMELSVIPVVFQFTQVVAETSVILRDADSRPHISDAPYDIFAIPAGPIEFADEESTAYVSYRIARTIEALTSENDLLDLQIFPYAPFPDEWFSYKVGHFYPPEFSPPSEYIGDFDLIVDSKVSVKGFVWWLRGDSRLTKYITHKIQTPSNGIEFKIQNECDMYRLCSPNWNGLFEFSATKNLGVNQFRVDLAFKPINPYIRVAPLFNGLYGTFSNDARGLICNGNFSFSRTSNAWIEYQRQNQNYEKIFNRQIENLEINNSAQATKDIVNAITGTVSGIASGALGGASVGGVVGGVAGGVVGGVASAIGGIADISINEMLRNESLDYTKDMYGYNLGNIQAIPTSITKVDTFTPNNRTFPVLEYYTCTEIEKEALRNKIKYNGMTIMRIGTISEFKQETPSYIKGKLIRLTSVADDYHVLNTIASELNKGVFI